MHFYFQLQIKKYLMLLNQKMLLLIIEKGMYLLVLGIQINGMVFIWVMDFLIRNNAIAILKN